MPWGGAFEVKSYGFMIMCGFLLALWIGQRRARRLGLDPTIIFDAAVAVLLAGIVGSRLFYVIKEWDRFRGNPMEIIRIDRGGLVFYGGLIGGAIVLLWFVRRHKMPLLRVLDLACSVVPLAHAFGRVGCFLNGCCYGLLTQSWAGMRFPRVLEPGNVDWPLLNVGNQHIVGSPPFVDQLQQVPPLVASTAEWSLPVHPTQLYEVGYNLLIFALLSYLLARRWREGEVAWFYAVLYGSARFVNEMYRAEPSVLFGLTIAQVICLVLILLGFVMFLRGRRLPRQPLAEPWVPPAESRGRDKRGRKK